MQNASQSAQIIPMGHDRARDDQNALWGSIIWRTLFSALQLPATDPSINQLAKQVGCTVAEVVDALEGLERLGLLQRTGSGYKILTDKLNRRSITNRQYADQILGAGLTGQQIINRFVELRESAEQAQEFNVVVYTSQKALVKELHQKIRVALDEFKEKSDACIPDGVYGVCSFATSMLKGESL